MPPRASDSVRLDAEHLGHRFGPRVLFRELSLSVRAGRSLAVTGANGSGKSTLLRILAGVLRPTAGRVRLTAAGRRIPGDERPRCTGLVAPYLHLYDGFSARENLAFLARVRRLPDAEVRIAAVLDRVGLAARAADPVAAFSSGMQQRLKYAAALLAEPPLLLLDEPAVALDAEGLAMVRDVQARWREAGRLLVVATNRPEEAARCDEKISVEDFSV